ncbi:hypothetical protein SHJG_3497 [Streptomyces hygroscopicus subsp. jinggangensis 5008]|nr:hypothetical protein SHJG_3497 [Streptomyces hygroscopicus subsp. jinggangensis 5008]AGF62927.1 hypothetical protein SHJGH_3262 [Streptomyces hygroscopicus subsp. jinggangensis TL01]
MGRPAGDARRTAVTECRDGGGTAAGRRSPKLLAETEPPGKVYGA